MKHYLAIGFSDKIVGAVGGLDNHKLPVDDSLAQCNNLISGIHKIFT